MLYHLSPAWASLSEITGLSFDKPELSGLAGIDMVKNIRSWLDDFSGRSCIDKSRLDVKKHIFEIHHRKIPLATFAPSHVECGNILQAADVAQVHLTCLESSVGDELAELQPQLAALSAMDKAAALSIVQALEGLSMLVLRSRLDDAGCIRSLRRLLAALMPVDTDTDTNTAGLNFSPHLVVLQEGCAAC